MDKTPKTALLLGWGGGIPFVGAAFAKIFGGPIVGLYALTWGTVYAGTMITFIGAVHWGIAIQHPDDKKRMPLIWSVLPALTVWPIMTFPPFFRLPFLIVGFFVVWIADMISYRRGHLPSWYMKLRHGHTLVAITSLLTIGLA